MSRGGLFVHWFTFTNTANDASLLKWQKSNLTYSLAAHCKSSPVAWRVWVHYRVAQWRSQGGPRGPSPPILQTKHKHSLRINCTKFANLGSLFFGKINTSAKEVMFLSEFVCLSVCQKDNSRSYERIFLKFWGNVRHDMSYKWFNFGDDPVGILHSGSLWSFCYHCVKGGISETAGKANMVTPPGE